MSAELQKELEPTVPAAQVKFRVKRFPSLLDKVHQRFQGAAQFDPVWTLRALPDLLAMRAVCPFLEDVDAAIAAAGRRFEVLDVDHKGEDRAFSDFGYSSTHLTLSIPGEILREVPRLEGFRVELQIRTILQDAWAEVEHELIYKVGAHPLNLQIRRKLAALNANLVLSDTIFQEIRDYQKSNIADLARARTAFLEQAESERVHSPQAAAVSRLNQAEVERLLKKALNAQIAGEMDDAVRIYSQLSGMALDHFTMSVVLNHRGMALEALGRHAEAIGDFARSRELDPKNARARINLALSLRRDRRLEEAESELRETLRIKPNSAHAHYGLARVLADQGDREGALASCQRALQFNPGFNLPLKLMQELQASPVDRAT